MYKNTQTGSRQECLAEEHTCTQYLTRSDDILLQHKIYFLWVFFYVDCFSGVYWDDLHTVANYHVDH